MTLEQHIRLLITNKRTLLLCISVVTFLGLLYSFLVSPLYRSEATILPISSYTHATKNPAIALPRDLDGIFSPEESSRDVLYHVLTSRNLARQIIERNNLLPDLFPKDKDRVRPPHIEQAVSKMLRLVEIDQQARPLLKVKVTTKDARLSMNIANFYTSELQDFIQSNALTLEKRNRIFLENQLKQSQETIEKLDRRLTGFRKTNKIIDFDTNAESLARTIAELQSQILVRDLQLRMLNQEGARDSYEVTRVEREKTELENQLEKLNRSSRIRPQWAFTDKPGEKNGDVESEYARIKRDLIAETETNKMLVSELQRARVRENSEEVVFQVLDRGIEAEVPFWPNKKLNLVISVMLGGILGILMIYLREGSKHFRRFTKTESENQIASLAS